AGVNPQAGAADALHTRDYPLAVRARLEDDLQERSGMVSYGLDLVTRDIALVPENPRHLQLDLRCGNAHLRVPRRVRVANAGQHVCNRVWGDADAFRHHQLDFVTPGMRPSAA